MNARVIALCIVSAAHCFSLPAAMAQEQATQPAATAPATKAAAKPKVYDEAADARQQIAAALKNAKREHRRVLIQWGGNWCPWCLKLHELFQSDAKLKQKLQYEYDVVHVDAGREDKNMDLAKSYGAACDKEGFPYLTILDEDGKVVANSGTPPFENDGKDVKAGHDPAKLVDFLTKHQASYPVAQTLLDDAVSRAKAEKKQVFLHFGAPWCGWCHKLEDWMARPEIAAIMAKDFIDLKIDVDRTVGGKELNSKMARPDGGGIPWIAIVECCGKTVADSNAPSSGNIGFPSKKEEVAYFGEMLKKAAVNMTPADIKTLTDSLHAVREADEKKRAGSAH
jgi:thiol-disulfide isomerase/thioredoxin